MPITPGRFHRVREGADATVIAVGPTLDAVVEATRHLDVTVLYAATVRPFNGAALRAFPSENVVLVAPYLQGTSANEVSSALTDSPHRLLSIGVPNVVHRHYGAPAEHEVAHGLDAARIKRRVSEFLAA